MYNLKSFAWGFIMQNSTKVFEILHLIEDTLRQIQNIAGESGARQLASVSKTMHSIFQPPIFNKFLQYVAFGMQDKAEKLFTDVYSGNSIKIQEALRYQGVFTDYSGRTFNCSAYEYAYWAKDAHMCRMLERYMDDETKAQLLARIDDIEADGLSYQQKGQTHQSAHVDLTPLKAAYRHLLEAEGDWDTMDAACGNLGKAQLNVPAHVAQEYCYPDRAFHPCPQFNEVSLPRVLTIFDSKQGCFGSWFSLNASNSGPGSKRAFQCGESRMTILKKADPSDYLEWPRFREDLAAITRLDEVRTADLRRSRENLTQAVSPSIGV